MAHRLLLQLRLDRIRVLLRARQRAVRISSATCKLAHCRKDIFHSVRGAFRVRARRVQFRVRERRVRQRGRRTPSLRARRRSRRAGQCRAAGAMGRLLVLSCAGPASSLRFLAAHECSESASLSADSSARARLPKSR